MRSSSTMISVPSRSTTGRSAAKYSGTIGMFSRWMYCQTSSSVQFEIGKTRIDSPLCLRALYRCQSSGRWFFGSQRCWSVRNEKMRSLARDFSSSRRAPPKADVEAVLVERLLQALRLPHVGVDLRAMVERVDAQRLGLGVLVARAAPCRARAPCVRATRTCRGTSTSCPRAAAGTAAAPGRTPSCARCSIAALSLPIEYSITGFSASATTSRMMWMLSASRRCRWVRGVRLCIGGGDIDSIAARAMRSGRS